MWMGRGGKRKREEGWALGGVAHDYWRSAVIPRHQAPRGANDVGALVAYTTIVPRQPGRDHTRGHTVTKKQIKNKAIIK